MTIPADVGDFVEVLTIHLAAMPSLGLTKGKNLFSEINYEEEGTPEGANESISLYDLGYPTPDPTFGYSRLEWSIRLLATRDRRALAIESLRPAINELIKARAFSATGFQVKNVKVDTAPEFAGRLSNSRFQAQAILIFTVIPTG